MCELTINSSFDKVILGHVIEMRVIQKRLREKERKKLRNVGLFCSQGNL